jgi:hypothetical protein
MVSNGRGFRIPKHFTVAVCMRAVCCRLQEEDQAMVRPTLEVADIVRATIWRESRINRKHPPGTVLMSCEEWDTRFM